jgi:arylsulfatase A-like enzyme
MLRRVSLKARGEVRNQYHHSTDIVATILDICGA